MEESSERALLSSDQRWRLLGCFVQEDARAQHVFAALRISESLDSARLLRAVASVQQRYDVMRALVSGGIEASSVSFTAPSALPPALVQTASGPFSQWVERASAASLEPSLPWGRINIARFPDGSFGLLLCIPRAGCDAHGLNHLVEALLHAYALEQTAVTAPLAPKVDERASGGLAEYLRVVHSDDSWKARLGATTERLGGDFPLVEWPTQLLGAAISSGRGRTLRVEVAAAVRTELADAARTLGVRLTDLVLAVYAAVIQRFCNLDEFTLGWFGPSRDWDGVAPVEGTSVIRVAVAPQTLLTDAVAQLAQLAQQARASLNVPYQELLQALKPARGAVGTRLFQVAFEQAPKSPEPRTIDGTVFEFSPIANTGAGTDLTLQVNDEGPVVELGLQYNVDAISESLAHAMLDAIRRGLAAITGSLELPLGRLCLLDRAQQQRAMWRPARQEYEAMRPAYVRFEQHADEQPHAVAVVMKGQQWTYRELDERANRLARRLRRAGVERETPVGIYCERSRDMLAAVLAVHKAGGAYVPLDPSHPTSRVQVVVHDAAPRVLITQKSLRDRCPVAQGCILIEVDDPTLRAEPSSRLNLPVMPDSLAYVIFTSGSTGRPKGVEIQHRAFTNFVNAMARKPGMQADDRILSVTTLSFDIAGLELLLPLFVGGSVEICDRATCVDARRLMTRLEDPAVTLMQATPATFRLLLEGGWRGNPRLRVLCGGEAFPPDLAAAILSRTAEVWNVYGPTETTVWSTAHRLMDSTPPIPIGTPIDNTSVYLLNACGEVVPRGAVGEIWIGGDGVARGYWGRADLTAERFCPDPFAEQAGARMYKTGDLGRLVEDGTPQGRLLCLGRVDFQVKIRGFRIELGDIESAILSEAEVRDAVVVARQQGVGDKRLVAYVTLGGDATDFGTRMREVLKQTLPSYMIPARFVVLDALPLNPSGKIDRKALPDPGDVEDAPDLNASDAEAPDDLAATVEAAFRDVLRMRSVDMDSSFFEVGGDSLLAVRLVRNIERSLGVRVPLALLFENPSISSLVDALRSGSDDMDQPRVVLLRRGTSEANLFCVYGVALYQHLARAMPEHLSVYGVFVPVETEMFAEERLARGRLKFPSVKELASQYVEVMRQVQPAGPYRLLGISFGGVVSYEIACQLRAAGEEVSLLGLLDALLPQATNTSVARMLMRRARDMVVKPHVRSAVKRLIGGRLGRTPRTAWSEVELEWLRDEIHDVQTARYARQLKPYDGTALIVHADNRKGYEGQTVDAAAGWQESIEGIIVEVRVPGDHLEIVAPPNVDVLAEHISPLL